MKLGEQRRFVLWWDGQEKRKATPGNLGTSLINDAPAAADFGLDRDTIHRWRKRLKDPAKFDAARADRKTAEAYKELEKAKRGPGKNSGLKSNPQNGRPTLAEIGIDKDEAKRLRALGEADKSKPVVAVLREGPGRPRKDRENAGGCPHFSRRERNNKQNKLARLDRDRPDLAARVRAGELSANAAAIEAGFRKPRTSLQNLRAA